MVALYTTWYNFVRVNSAVKKAAGVSNRPWEIADIVVLIDAAEPELKPRGPYKKRILN